MRVAIDPNTRKATTEVVSEDEDIMAPIEALDYLKLSCSKGSSLKRCSYSLSLQNKPNKRKISSSMLNVLSHKKQAKERLCCIFPESMMELKPVVDKIFYEEMAIFMESKKMKKIFHNINVRAIVENKNSIKNLVVKTKFQIRSNHIWVWDYMMHKCFSNGI